MSKSLEEVIALGPFEDAIVSSPREVEPAVRGLNDDALNRVFRVFERLRREDPPHPPVKAPRAQRVFSPAPGYGKSHLIGRLFQKLGSRATRVYVHPFESASTAWTSLLRSTIQELTKPESGDEVAQLSGTPNQLDAIAHGVLGQGLALMIRDGQADVEGLPNAQKILSEGISSNWDLSNFDLPLTQAFGATFEELIPDLGGRIGELGISFSNHWSSPAAWLRVLCWYAYARGRDPAIREQCLAWLRGNAYQEEDFSGLQLDKKDLVPSTLDTEELGSVARARLFDLCQLASFYRPFLLCFDQTETYKRHASLARELGYIVCTLVNEAPNQLSVVTANHYIWQECIEPEFEDAHKARFDRAVWMEGITPAQGDELIRARLKRFDVDDQEIRRFQQRVRQRRGTPAGSEAQTSVRQFIHHCHEILNETPRGDMPGNEAPPSPSPPPRPTLEYLFQKEYEQCVSKEDDLRQYNNELFRWVLLNGLGAERTRTPHGYFPLMLKQAGGGHVLFGLEERTHHSCWKARLNEARERFQQHGAISVHIRLENQKPIPGNWKNRKEFEEAQEKFFRIHVLSTQRVAKLHALWNLYSKACQQDIDYSENEVMEFLTEKLKPWKDELIAQGRDDPTPATLGDAVSQILQRYRFIAFNGLQQCLEDQLGRKVGQNEVVEACQGNRHITIKHHPSNAVFLWQ